VRSRYRILVGLVLAFALIAAACGDDDSGGDTTTTTEAMEETTTTEAMEETTTTEAMEETTTTTAAAAEALVVWADENRSPAILAIAPEFEAATGVPVEVVQKDFAAIRDEAIQLIPTGEGPDVFIGAHDWTGPLSDAGVVAPLNDLPADTAADFFDPSLTAFTLGGSLYALPFQMEGIAMWMNTTLAATTDAPATFEELTTLCDSVLSGDQACIALPGGGDGADAYHMFPFQSAFGGSIFTFDPSTGYTADRAGIDEPESIAGAEFMAGLVEAGYIPSYNYGNAQEAFQQGNALFWMTGPWARGDAETGAAENGFEIQVITVPTMEGNTPRPFFGSQGFFISSQTTQELVAKTFVYDYAAAPEVQQALYDADPRLPANRTVAEVVSADPIVAAFTQSIANGQPMPNIPQMTGDVWDSWGAAMLQIRNGESDPTTALTAAGEQINGLIGA
jgi:arabinogalactan oligomer/maltooligosaccharide transport system substrate-binding protein